MSGNVQMLCDAVQMVCHRLQERCEDEQLIRELDPLCNILEQVHDKLERISLHEAKLETELKHSKDECRSLRSALKYQNRSINSTERLQTDFVEMQQENRQLKKELALVKSKDMTDLEQLRTNNDHLTNKCEELLKCTGLLRAQLQEKSAALLAFETKGLSSLETQKTAEPSSVDSSMQSTGATMLDTDAPRAAEEPVWEFAWNRAIEEPDSVASSQEVPSVEVDESFHCEGPCTEAQVSAFDQVDAAKLYSLLGEVYHQLAVVNTERLDLIEHNADLRDELKAVEGGSHWELMHRCSALQEQVGVYSKVLIQMNNELDQLGVENQHLKERVKRIDPSDGDGSLPEHAELLERNDALEYENQLYDATIRQMNDAIQKTDQENAKLKSQLVEVLQLAENVVRCNELHQAKQVIDLQELPDVASLRSQFDILHARCSRTASDEEPASAQVVNELGSVVYMLYDKLLCAPCTLDSPSKEDLREKLSNWKTAGVGGTAFQLTWE
jgi:hypothetical protein